jgi:hypothetical protein
MFTGIANIETIDILDKVFLCLITCYRFEVVNGSNLRQAISAYCSSDDVVTAKRT